VIKLRKSADADSDTAARQVESIGGGRDKRLLAVAGGVGALVIAGGAFFLLHGGSSDDASTATAAVPRAVKATTATTAAATPTPIAAPGTVPPAAQTAVGKNPFKALIVPKAASADSSATGAGASATTTATPSAAATTSAYTPYDLTVNSISPATDENRTASVTFGTKTLSVLKGQTFGQYGELVVLGFSGDTGVIVQAGDGAPQTLTVGSKTTVA
jgi:uncharacterized iron-regulated membrane protein